MAVRGQASIAKPFLIERQLTWIVRVLGNRTPGAGVIANRVILRPEGRHVFSLARCIAGLGHARSMCTRPRKHRRPASVQAIRAYCCQA